MLRAISTVEEYWTTSCNIAYTLLQKLQVIHLTFYAFFPPYSIRVLSHSNTTTAIHLSYLNLRQGYLAVNYDILNKFSLIVSTVAYLSTSTISISAKYFRRNFAREMEMSIGLIIYKNRRFDYTWTSTAT